MIIKISKLQSGLNQWKEQIFPADLDLDPEFYHRPITVELEAEMLIGKVILKIISRTEGDFICDRCGDDCSITVSGEMQTTFIERHISLPDELPGDDLRTFRPGQDSLDLSTEVRDALILSLPIQILCRDDCQGFCVKCGANLNFTECSC